MSTAMSTSLALMDRNNTVSQVTLARSVAPVLSFAELTAMAKAAHESGLFPTIRSPAQALTIAMTGQELGIPPMVAIRTVYVIEGKPALAAELMLALFRRAGGRHRWVETTDTRAVLWLQRPDGDEYTQTYTMEDARRAELAGKKVWKQYPAAMLRGRATSAGIRAIAPDIISGMYTPEELGADVTESGEVVSVPAQIAAPTPTPAAPDPGTDDDAPPPEMSADEAFAYAYPFERGKPQHGRPIGEFSTPHLESVASWIVGRMTEKGDDLWHRETLTAIRTVLAERAKDQLTMEMDEATDDAPPAGAEG